MGTTPLKQLALLAVVGERCRVIFATSSLSEYLGISHGDLVGKPLPRLSSGDGERSLCAAVTQILSGSVSEARVVTDDATFVLHRSSGSELSCAIFGQRGTIPPERFVQVGEAQVTSQRLRAAGRTSERAIFRDLLSSTSWPAHVLYLHGPLGTGKSTLIEVYRAMCADAGLLSYGVDARAVACAPSAIDSSVLEALGASSLTRIWSVIPDLTRKRWVLFVDGFERWQPLAEHFLRSTVTALPSTALVVVASRVSPSSRWGWDWTRNAIVQRLDVLPPAEATEALALRGIPEDARAALTRRTSGHPLCIAVRAAEHSALGGTADFPSSSTLGSLAEMASAQVERETLEIAAFASRITEDLLASVLRDGAGAADAYRSLETICTIAPEGYGLRMPGVLREAVGLELRRRNPSRHADVQARIVRFFGECIESGLPGRSSAALKDFYDTFIDHPVIRMFWAGDAHEEITVDTARSSDRPAVEAYLRRHVSEATAAMTQRRLARYPDSLFVARDRSSRAVGFMQALLLPTETLMSHGSSDDAVLAGFGDALRRRTSSDSSAVLVVPFVSVGPALDATLAALATAAARMAMRNLAVDGALAFLPLDHPLVTALQFLPPYRHELIVDGARHALIGCDFTNVSRSALLSRLLDYEPERPSCPQSQESGLDEVKFAEAVRACLPNLSLPVKLTESSLVHSLMVQAEAPSGSGVEERAEVLARSIKRAIETLSSRDEKAYRVLHATFVDRVGTHEEISEELDLSYSTFRRHLARAIELLVRTLVIQENDLRRKRRPDLA